MIIIRIKIAACTLVVLFFIISIVALYTEAHKTESIFTVTEYKGLSERQEVFIKNALGQEDDVENRLPIGTTFRDDLLDVEMTQVKRNSKKFQIAFKLDWIKETSNNNDTLIIMLDSRIWKLDEIEIYVVNDASKRFQLSTTINDFSCVLYELERGITSADIKIICSPLVKKPEKKLVLGYIHKRGLNIIPFTLKVKGNPVKPMDEAFWSIPKWQNR